MRVCGPNDANGSNIVALRFGDHVTKETVVVLAQKFHRLQNLRNNMQQGLQKRMQHLTCVTSNNVGTE